MAEAIEGSLKAGRGFRKMREVEISDRRGGRIPVGLTISVISDRSSQLRTAIALLVDLSERKELEMRLRRADRLTALGRMAAGVAHEIRNPLGSIRGLTQLINEELDGRDELRTYAEAILREVDRLNHIVEGVLELSAGVSSNRSRGDVRNILDDTLSLLKYNIDAENIEVEAAYPDAPQMVYADADQLRRAFLNIAINAVQSMPEGGKLRVGVGRGRGGKEIVIEFSDTGVGMREDDMEKVFEPFYSTKEKGIGLGLPISHRIISDHGGSIDIRSRVGQGTTVRIRLPAADAEG